MMQTTAGSFALLRESRRFATSTVGRQTLRAGGRGDPGKNEPVQSGANFRLLRIPSAGGRAAGGQTNNPLWHQFAIPAAPVSGSGAAASANFATVSFWDRNRWKYRLPREPRMASSALSQPWGLTSRGWPIVPISHGPRTLFGPHGRTVADAAVALGVVQSRGLPMGPRSPATGGVPLGWQGRFHASPPTFRLTILSFLKS